MNHPFVCIPQQDRESGATHVHIIIHPEYTSSLKVRHSDPICKGLKKIKSLQEWNQISDLYYSNAKNAGMAYADMSFYEFVMRLLGDKHDGPGV